MDAGRVNRSIEEAEALASQLEQANAELKAALAAAESARVRAQESEALVRISEEREHFLAEASRVLGSSMDFETTIQRVAKLAVPKLADWCGVDVFDEEGELNLIAVAHVQPEKIQLARELRRRYPAPDDAPTGIRAVIRTGKTEFYPEITDAMIEATAVDEGHLNLVRGLDLHGVIIAPLTAADQIFGALTLVSSRRTRRYTEADVALAEELAHRAALAIQSARLYAVEQEARRRAEEMARRADKLQAVTAALSRAATPGDVADSALGDSVNALGASHGGLFMLGPDGRTVELIKAIGFDEQTARDFRALPLQADLPLSEAVRENRLVLIDSREAMLDRYPILRSLNRPMTTRAWAMTPLAIGDRVLGGIAWGYMEDRQFTEADRDFIDSVARHCALAIERAQLYAAERAARESAQAANRAKSDFLATMSHELRTPINAIQGYAQLLDLGIPGPVTDQQREYLGRLTSSSEHLLGLVNEVLDLAKIESGTIDVESEAVIAGETVDAALSLIRPQAAAKELSLSERCEGARETPYLGDEHRVRQILTNLLSNAVKFTDPGGRVGVECAMAENVPELMAGGREGPFVVFRVSDTGAGIESDQLDRIFDPFTQADTVHRNPYTRGSTGTGLGLTISRRLARLMGGELTVVSVPGRGSVFSLWMPLVERRSEPRVAPESPPFVSTAQIDEPEIVSSIGESPMPGLAGIAEGLLKETRAILDDFVARVRADANIPSAARSSESQIEDHMATFIADVSIGLRLLEIAGGDPSDLLRDSSVIIRTIMQQHGSQRFRLGWSEEAINAEMGILRDVTCDAVRRVARDTPGDADRACVAVGQFVAQATRHTIASYRLSAATLQHGAMRGSST